MLDGIMGTIDQQVDDKKDLLRANPGMQGTVGKDLIGVMALQKMQKEKQAAENELMLAQQNNPQLEREVAGLTQNEMALQTAGIMNQRQQQQQQRRPQQQQQRPQGIQQAARPPMGGAPRPPMGGAPRPPMAGAPRPPMPQGAGIAGAPRPPMMAQGGIVGFNTGNVVISDERLKELGMTRAQFDALPAGTKAALAPKQPPKLGKTREERSAERGAATAERTARREKQSADFNQKMQDARQRQARSAAEAAGLQIADPSKPIGPQEMAEMDAASAAVDKKDPNTFTVDQAKDYVRDQYNNMAASDTDTDTTSTPTTPPTTAPQAAGTDLAGMLEGKLNTGVTEEQKATIGQKQASGRLDSGIKTTLDSMSKGDDPLAAMKAAQAQGDERYNKNYTAGTDPTATQAGTGLKGLRAEERAERERQLSENELRKQRLRAGAIQRGGLSGARARAEQNADARRLDMYKKAASDYSSDMKNEVEKLKAVDTTAARIMEQIAADRRVAVQVFGDLSMADQTAVTADLDRFQRQNQAAMEGLLAGMKIESEEKLMQSIQNAKDSAELTGYWEKISAEKSKAMQEYLESAEYMSLDESKKPSARATRELSIASRFEKTELFIIKRLEQLGGGVDLSVFYPQTDNSAEFQPKNKQEADDLQIR